MNDERMKTALLAEDTMIGLTIGKAMLEALGYRVTAVEDGPSAIDAASMADFDCALLDLQLPGLGGLSVARSIRLSCQIEERRLPRIVAMTASRPDWIEAELAAGTFQAFLEKPLRPGPLRSAFGLDD